MKLLQTIILASFTLLSGCAYQQTPYEVVETINYKKGALSKLKKLGVSEQKASATVYVLSVRLDNGSDAKRAKNMRDLHAANLAINNGYDSVIIETIIYGNWCLKQKSNTDGSISIVDAGPSTAARVEFVNSGKSEHKKLKNAQQIVAQLSLLVSQKIDPKQAMKNSENTFKACLDNS